MQVNAGQCRPRMEQSLACAVVPSCNTSLSNSHSHANRQHSLSTVCSQSAWLPRWMEGCGSRGIASLPRVLGLKALSAVKTQSKIDHCGEQHCIPPSLRCHNPVPAFLACQGSLLPLSPAWHTSMMPCLRRWIGQNDGLTAR